MKNKKRININDFKISKVEDLITIFNLKNFFSVKCNNEKNGFFNIKFSSIIIDEENKNIYFKSNILEEEILSSSKITFILNKYLNYDLKIITEDNKKHIITYHNNNIDIKGNSNLYLFIN